MASLHGTTVGKSQRRVRGRDHADHRSVTSKHARAIRLAVERKNNRQGLVGAERRLSFFERPDTDDRQDVADEPLLCFAPRAIISLVLRPARRRADSAIARSRTPTTSDAMTRPKNERRTAYTTEAAAGTVAVTSSPTSSSWSIFQHNWMTDSTSRAGRTRTA